jgi:hypothetical protein
MGRSRVSHVMQGEQDNRGNKTDVQGVLYSSTMYTVENMMNSENHTLLHNWLSAFSVMHSLSQHRDPPKLNLVQLKHSSMDCTIKDFR